MISRALKLSTDFVVLTVAPVANAGKTRDSALISTRTAQG
jgi:hypothetical protein